MKYLTKITKKNFQFSCDTQISLRMLISAIFEAGNQAKFSKTLHSDLPTTPGNRYYTRRKTRFRHGIVVQLSWLKCTWFMSWFKPLKSTKQMWGGGGRGKGGQGPRHRYPSLTHFTHGP